MSKISELSDGGVIQGGDTLIAVRSGGNVKVTYGGSTTANIDGGTIDGTVIGGTTPAAVTTTALVATTADINAGTIDGTVIGGTTAAAGTFTTGQFDTSLNVDGTVTADGLNVTGGGFIDSVQFENSDSFPSNPSAHVGRTSGAGTGVFSEAGHLYLSPRSSGALRDVLFATGNPSVLRSRIASNGDISFYEDTGTTPKFFWDASAESLGIGTSSPDAILEVDGSASTDGILITNPLSGSFYNAKVEFRRDSTLGGAKIQTERNTAGGVGLSFNVTADNTAELNGTYSQAMTLDRSGNVGIGTTPAGTVLLDLKEPNSTDDLILGLSAGTGARAQIRSVVQGSSASSEISFSTTASGVTNERMRIDSSGNLGLGVTPSAWLSTFRAIQLGQGSSLWGAATGNNAGFDSNAYVNTSGASIYVGSTSATRYQQNDGKHKWYNAPSGTAGNAITFTQAMTLDASGNLLVGTTSNISSSGVRAGFLSSGTASDPAIDVAKVDGTTSSSAYFIRFHASSGGTAMGAIAGNGAANVQFISVSDKRLKENIQPLSGSLDKVLALNPVSYDWKASGEHIEAGFVAQEVEQVLPEYVATEEDEQQTKALTGGMTAGYIAVLTKAIQEQQEIINDLRARVAQLEGAN